MNTMMSSIINDSDSSSDSDEGQVVDGLLQHQSKHNNSSTTDKDNNSNIVGGGITGDIAGSKQTTPYTVRHRTLIWSRQICYLIIVVLLLWKLMMHFTVYTLDYVMMFVLTASFLLDDKPHDKSLHSDDVDEDFNSHHNRRGGVNHDSRHRYRYGRKRRNSRRSGGNSRNRVDLSRPYANSISGVQSRKTITWRWLLVDLSQLLYSCMCLFQQYGDGYIPLHITVLILSISGFSFSFLDLLWQPEYTSSLPPTVEFTCPLVENLSFSYLNALLIHPARAVRSFGMELVPHFMDVDAARCVWHRFNSQLYDRMTNSFHNDSSDSVGGSNESDGRTVRFYDLMCSIFEIIKADIWSSAAFAYIQSFVIFIAPLALQRILDYLATEEGVAHDLEPNVDGYLFSNVGIYTALGLLFGSRFVSAVLQGQWLCRGRHMGVQVRAAIVSAVMEKAFKVDTGEALRDGLGKIINLVSVDSRNIREFAVYTPWLVTPMLEILLCIILLYYVLGMSATGGLIVMLIGFPSAMKLSNV